jgi:gamma-glutamyl-gamma-aminobutyrate hydrolase PuuD
MRVVAVSQRRLPPTRRGAIVRDALDIRWPKWLSGYGMLAIALPNEPDLAIEVLASLPVHGVVLGGGDALVANGGTSQACDDTEMTILRYAHERGLPVLGVCRGMQLMVHYFGGRTYRDECHANVRHTIVVRGRPQEVVCSHKWTVREVPDDLQEVVRCGHLVEAIQHPVLPWLGTMWHPEKLREPACGLGDQFIEAVIEHSGSGNCLR